jgi:hypothetical protein
MNRYSLHRRLQGTQGRSGRVWNISLTSGFDRQTVKIVASLCTGYVILAHSCQFSFSHLIPVSLHTLTGSLLLLLLLLLRTAMLLERCLLHKASYTLEEKKAILSFKDFVNKCECNAFKNTTFCWVSKLMLVISSQFLNWCVWRCGGHYMEKCSLTLPSLYAWFTFISKQVWFESLCAHLEKKNLCLSLSLTTGIETLGIIKHIIRTVCMYICMYIYINKSVYVCMYVCTYVYTYYSCGSASDHPLLILFVSITLLTPSPVSVRNWTSRRFISVIQVHGVIQPVTCVTLCLVFQAKSWQPLSAFVCSETHQSDCSRDRHVHRTGSSAARFGVYSLF